MRRACFLRGRLVTEPFYQHVPQELPLGCRLFKRLLLPGFIALGIFGFSGVGHADAVYEGGFLPDSLSVIDPYAANWSIGQASFPNHFYHLSLKMKRVYSGGAGEARAVFQQRAKEIMLENGFDSFMVVEYSEGLNSSTFGSQRVAEGVIQLTRK